MPIQKQVVLTTVILAIFSVFTVPVNAPAGEKAEMAYVEWADAIATANIVKEAVEANTDYIIELTPVSAAAMWQALASGDVDFITCAWVPATHGHYLERVGDRIIDLGPNVEGAQIGLVVPTYVEIDSIAELNDHAERFNGQITGIDPGAGIMSRAEEAIEVYNMDRMDLMESADAMMTAVLADKYEAGEWVVVTGWVPHWKFGKYDLKYLEDPENVFGDAETVNTVTRLGLDEDMPELFAIIDNYKLELEELHEVMAWIAETGDVTGSARRWIDENPDRVASWMP